MRPGTGRKESGLRPRASGILESIRLAPHALYSVKRPSDRSCFMRFGLRFWSGVIINAAVGSLLLWLELFHV